MGLFGFMKNEFIEVVEWVDNTQNTILWKFPIDGKQQIKNEAQLIVRQSQIAVFVYEGQIADIYVPGKYSLTTETMPIVTSFHNWKYGFNSPFKTDIYFINSKEFLGQKWGTSSPISIRDKDFFAVNVGARGQYSFKISNPQKFLETVAGTNEYYSVQKVEDNLKGIIITGVKDAIAESGIPALDLSSQLTEISCLCKEELLSPFDRMGFELTEFRVEHFHLPQKIQDAIDRKGEMSIIGDVNQYAAFQAADAIKDAAQNEGMGGMGVSMGVGAAVGNIMGKTMGENFQEINKKEIQQTKEKICPNCNTPNLESKKFCGNCGSSFGKKCISCGADLPLNMKFCGECGASQEPKKRICQNCGAEVANNMRFCGTCGNSMDV